MSAGPLGLLRERLASSWTKGELARDARGGWCWPGWASARYWSLPGAALAFARQEADTLLPSLHAAARGAPCRCATWTECLLRLYAWQNAPERTLAEVLSVLSQSTEVAPMRPLPSVEPFGGLSPPASFTMEPAKERPFKARLGLFFTEPGRLPLAALTLLNGGEP